MKYFLLGKYNDGNIFIVNEDELESCDIENIVVGTTILEPHEQYKHAIIGYYEGRAVYDYDLLIQAVSEMCECDTQDAIDHIEFNILGSLPYIQNNPYVVQEVPDGYEEENN